MTTLRQRMIEDLQLRKLLAGAYSVPLPAGTPEFNPHNRRLQRGILQRAVPYIRDHTVKMRMEQQGLAQRMEYGEETDMRAKAPRICKEHPAEYEQRVSFAG